MKILKNKVLPFHGSEALNIKDLPDVGHLNLFRQVVGEDYVINANNEPIIIGLVKYFNGLENSPYSLKKGILIYGDFGCGKTTLLNAIKEYINYIAILGGGIHPNQFKVTSIEELLFKFRNSQDMSVFSYNVDSYSRIESKKPNNIVINEFGSEYADIKVYGTNFKEYMDTFYMQRYEVFQQYGKVTHGTTNFDTKAIKSKFSPKLIDRFSEMFTMIHLKGESFRNKNL